MFDGEAFGQHMVEIVRGYVDSATAPLMARIDAQARQIAELEQRELLLPEKGEPGERGPQGDAGPAGEVDMTALKSLVGEAVAALPPPERGEPGLPGEKGADGQRGADGKDGRDGRDGADFADAFIDKDGHLVVTLTDGRTKALCNVVGRDGEPGKDGETFTLDDFDIVPLGDERSFAFRFEKGEVRHTFEFALPVPIYRGVFKDGCEYARGDMVTWAGSLWHCNEPKGLKPGEPDSGWQLAAKAGRPGKDAK